MASIQLFAVLIIAAMLSFGSCLPVPNERERNSTGPTWNWVNGILASGGYANKLLNPLNVNASNDQLSHVMESVCNLTEVIRSLATINSTEAHDLQLVLEKVVMEGCKLLKANESDDSGLTDCTPEDLLNIQTACVSKQLALLLNSHLKQAFKDHSNDITRLYPCEWLKERVPRSESIQTALNCM